MNKLIINHRGLTELALSVANSISHFGLRGKKCYAIPRGGVSAAYVIQKYVNFHLVDTPHQADFFIDDLLDSGETMRRFCDEYPGRPFLTLINKSNSKYWGRWIVFPWEVEDDGTDKSATDIITRLLEYVGEDPKREGLAETPARVLKAWDHWTSGYKKDAGAILKVFEDGAEGCDQMIVRKDIPIYSHCEHHLAAIVGRCTIAYIPNGKIAGLSKLDRLADMFARRLQVQERLTNQIADALVEHLNPLGVGVWISARHLCVESRGVASANSETITTALRGCIREQDAARAEFLALARS